MDFINLIKTELILDIKKITSYKVSFLTDILIFAMVLFSVFITGLDSAFSRSYGININSGKMIVLIGFIFWQISTTALGWSSANIRGQSISGTLELKMQSKYSAELLLFIEMITYLIISFLSFFIIFIIFVLSMKGDFKDIIYILISYLVAIPALIGMYGMGLFMGGIALKEKEVGSLIFILQSALIFLSDVTAVRSRLFNIIPFNAGIKIKTNVFRRKYRKFSNWRLSFCKYTMDYFWCNYF
ncbi:MAG: ABC transporter [Peptoniphilaceae bacterium]|nr:ABC transporter [Peptoniphilaceae bacterium]